MMSWTVLLQPNSALRAASKRPDAAQPFGVKITAETTADDFLHQATTQCALPKGRVVTLFEEQQLMSQDPDGAVVSVAVEAGTIVDSAQKLLDDAEAEVALEDSSINRIKHRISLQAGLGTAKQQASSTARAEGRNTLTAAQAEVMRGAIDKFGSRDSTGAFHLKTGSPAQWPLAIEATVATVLSKHPDVDRSILGAAITKCAVIHALETSPHGG